MKKGFTLIELLSVIALLAVVSLIAYPIISGSIQNSKERAYEEQKKMIVEAAKTWGVYNTDKLPDIDSSDTYSLGLPELITGGYIVDTENGVLKNPIDNTDMTGCVKIYYSSNFNQYIYEYDESCIIYPSLIDLLLNDYMEGATTGLVKDDTDEDVYYFKGTNKEVNNNYLWYGGHHWRVLEFDTNEKTLTLIATQPLTSIQPASTVWKTKQAYENSYINTWLNDYFYNSLDSKIQKNILETTFNIGAFDNVEEITTIQKVGLLDYDQYNKFNWVFVDDNFWIGNRVTRVDGLYLVNIDVLMVEGAPYLSSSVRPVIKINDIRISGGDGTLTSNYKTETKATGTGNVQVGEYINVATTGNQCGSDKLCTFRVVSKDSDSIKVVLNGLLPDESVYGATTTITTSHTIYTSLNTFANSISNDYRYIENKDFYIGDYPYVTETGQNYLDVQDEILSANVGLPTIGEMFSGNDIDLGTSTTKSFVDISRVENATASSSYWTMNRVSSSYSRLIFDSGDLDGYNVEPTRTFGVRPVIFLKSDLTFTGGDGTAQNPYILN